MAKFDPQDLPTPKVTEREVSASGSFAPPDSEVVEAVSGLGMSMADELAFMEEKVYVLVHDPLDEGDEPVVELGVNGVKQYVIRGEPQWIKRKFVESLARAKRVHTSATYKIQGMDAKNIVKQHKSQRYPFQVLEDKNPKGPAWLRGVLET